MRLQLGRLLQHHDDRLRLHQRRRALVGQTLGDRARVGSRHDGPFEIVPRQLDGLGRLALVRLRDGERRAQALAPPDATAGSRDGAPRRGRRSAAICRLSACATSSPRRRLAERHLEGGAIDLEERRARLDAVALERRGRARWAPRPRRRCDSRAAPRRCRGPRCAARWRRGEAAPSPPRRLDPLERGGRDGERGLAAGLAPRGQCRGEHQGPDVRARSHVRVDVQIPRRLAGAVTRPSLRPATFGAGILRGVRETHSQAAAKECRIAVAIADSCRDGSDRPSRQRDCMSGLATPRASVEAAFHGTDRSRRSGRRAPISGRVSHPLWGRGFRPFFLFGSVYGALAIVVWTATWHGWLPPPAWLTPPWWHAHEMLFGFAAAAIAGFLLTASPVWTGRPALEGRPLAALVALWILGRLAMLAAGILPRAARRGDRRGLPAGRRAGRSGPDRPGDGSVQELRRRRPGRSSRPRQRRRARAGVGARCGVGSAGAARHDRRGGRARGGDRRAHHAGVHRQRVPPERDRGAGAVVALARSARRHHHRPRRRWPISSRPAASRAACWPPPRASRSARASRGGRRYGPGAIRWCGPSTPAWRGSRSGSSWSPRGISAAPSRATAGLHALTAGAMGTMIMAVVTRVSLGHTGRALVLPEGAALSYVLVHAGALAACRRFVGAGSRGGTAAARRRSRAGHPPSRSLPSSTRRSSGPPRVDGKPG